MAWIKRNLFFVISLVVGVCLIGAAGYFVYATFSANSDARDQYTGALNDYTQLQQKKPYPSPENIQLAKEDSVRVAALVTNLGKVFVNFPPAAAVAEPRQFINYLNTNLVELRAGASNANVALPSPEYDFTFADAVGVVSFNPASFRPWMEQVEEIRAILEVLYSARVNSLDILQRTPVAGEATGTTDFLDVPGISNQVEVVSPYRIAFRGFSDEIAKVLKGFAESRHCFLIKDLRVESSRGVAQGAGFGQPAPMQQEQVNPFGPGAGRFPGRQNQGPGPRPNMPGGPGTAVAPAATGPVTILKPMPLFVTMRVDVVKLNR